MGYDGKDSGKLDWDLRREEYWNSRAQMGVFSFANIDGRSHQGCWARHRVAGAVAAASSSRGANEQSAVFCAMYNSSIKPKQ